METTSNNIVLVGLMGSGKTTVGRRLAHELNQDFYDTDHHTNIGTEKIGEYLHKKLQGRSIFSKLINSLN